MPVESMKPTPTSNTIGRVITITPRSPGCHASESSRWIDDGGLGRYWGQILSVPGMASFASMQEGVPFPGKLHTSALAPAWVIVCTWSGPAPDVTSQRSLFTRSYSIQFMVASAGDGLTRVDAPPAAGRKPTPVLAPPDVVQKTRSGLAPLRST